MKQFLIIDDHVVIRTGIKFLLSEKFQGSEISEACDGETAILSLNNKNYELVIMDIQMPNTNSLSLMEYIKKEHPATKVLVYSMSAEKIYAKLFLKNGAMGFLSKNAPLEEIMKAIETVLDNKKYISAEFAEILADNSYKGITSSPFSQLSKRELEITKLLLSGQTLTEISKSLDLKISTVGTLKQRMFKKLDIDNLLELNELATTNNL